MKRIFMILVVCIFVVCYVNPSSTLATNTCQQLADAKQKLADADIKARAAILKYADSYRKVADILERFEVALNSGNRVELNLCEIEIGLMERQIDSLRQEILHYMIKADAASNELARLIKDNSFNQCE